MPTVTLAHVFPLSYTPDADDPHPGITTLPGRDHRSLLLFLQTVEANHGGDVRAADIEGCYADAPTRMRNKRRHTGDGGWNPKYGTRYDDGRIDGEHDDWDALIDLETWGFVRLAGTGLHPVATLTAKGHALAAALIRDRAERQRAAQEGRAEKLRAAGTTGGT